MRHRNENMDPKMLQENQTTKLHRTVRYVKLEPFDTESEDESESPVIVESVSRSDSDVADVSEVVDIKTQTERRRKPTEPFRVKQQETGRSIPIRCHIEPSADADSQERNEGDEQSSVVDTYAIIPSITPFCEVVRVALLKLGYSMADAVGAKGWIQIKNWLPLSPDQISSSKDSTVEDMLADVSSFVTLKIKICSLEKEDWTCEDVSKAVLSLLRHHSMSQLKLSKLCRLPQPVLSNIINDREIRLSRDKCRTFKQWYRDFTVKAEAIDDVQDTDAQVPTREQGSVTDDAGLEFNESIINAPLLTAGSAADNTTSFHCSGGSVIQVSGSVSEQKTCINTSIISVPLKSPTDVFVCDACGLVYTSVNGLKNHTTVKHGKPKYRCSICGKAFTWESTQRIHEKSHLTHKERAFKCAQCHAVYTRRHNLNLHIRIKHAAGAIISGCSYCGKKVGTSNMARHIKAVHRVGSTKVHMCVTCGASFTTRGNLKRHSHSHSKD